LIPHPDHKKGVALQGQILLGIYTFLFGLAIGSFLNVCIYRLPKDESIVHPPSRCTLCGWQLRWYENIPVLSYILLRGKCSNCRMPVSFQYPIVELTTGLIFLLNYYVYGIGLIFFTNIIFTAIVLALAITDARSYLLPDVLTIGGLVFGVGLSLFSGGMTPQESIFGSIVGGGILFVVAWLGEIVFKKEAMGGGDIKMMAMIGTFVGWQGALLTIFLGSLFGTLIFAPISLKTKKLVPFGVFLAIGGTVALYFGRALIQKYIELLVR